MVRPLRSFGKKSVDFWGMTEPAKATSRSWSMVTGLVRKVTSASPRLHLVDGFGGVAEVAEVGLLADLFGIEAEEFVEDDGVEMAQVELTLVFGKAGKWGCRGIGF